MSWVEKHGTGMFGDFACWMVVGEKFEYRMIGITIEFWGDRFEFGCCDRNVLVVDTVVASCIVECVDLMA